MRVVRECRPGIPATTICRDFADRRRRFTIVIYPRCRSLVLRYDVKPGGGGGETGSMGGGDKKLSSHPGSTHVLVNDICMAE